MAVSYNEKRKRTPYCVELYENGRRIARRHCRTKTQAEALDSSWRAQKATGVKLVVDSRLSPRFKDFVEGAWITHYKQKAAVPTWQKRLAELRWHAFPIFGQKRLSDVTAADILDFQARMLSLRKVNGSAVTSQTIKNARSAISIVFEYAKGGNLVAVNPVRLLGRDQSRLPTDKPAMTIWTEDEVNRFLLHLAKVDFLAYVAYQTLILTGMRPGEMRGICRDQINFDKGCIVVRRQYGQREKGVVDRCKHGSERTFEMPPALEKILRRYCEGFEPGERLFPFVTGNFLWRKRQLLMQAAGVRVIRNHDMRHTVAAAIYREGMKRGDADIVAKLARLLGHKKLSQTYHYLEGLLRTDEPSNAAATLTWGAIEDDFVVAAASRMARKSGTKETSRPIAPAPSIVVALPYPTPIGRPRKSPSQTITPKSPPSDAGAMEAGQKT